MRVLGRPVSALTAADLDGLVGAEVAEDQAIEFKVKLPLTSIAAAPETDLGKRQKDADDAKTEFLKDVAAFANTRGGTILYGIAERAGGIASKVVGLAGIPLVPEKLRLEQLLASGLSPALSGHDIVPVPHSSGDVLAVGIPRSLNGPHMVMGPNKIAQFWRRTSAGRCLMTIDEIRRVVLESDEWSKAIESYRAQRLEFARRIPVNWAGGLVILHVLPLGRLADRLDLRGKDDLLGQHFGGDGRNAIPNLDGLLYRQPISDGLRQWIQWFRHGGTEHCWSITRLTTQGKHPTRRFVFGEALNDVIVEALRSSMAWLDGLGVAPPIALSLSLMSVNDVSLIRNPNFPFDTDRPRGIDRADLLLPTIVIDSRDGFALAQNELLDLMWQSAGWQSNPLAVKEDGTEARRLS